MLDPPCTSGCAVPRSICRGAAGFATNPICCKSSGPIFCVWQPPEDIKSEPYSEASFIQHLSLLARWIGISVDQRSGSLRRGAQALHRMRAGRLRLAQVQRGNHAAAGTGRTGLRRTLALAGRGCECWNRAFAAGRCHGIERSLCAKTKPRAAIHTALSSGVKQRTEKAISLPPSRSHPA